MTSFVEINEEINRVSQKIQEVTDIVNTSWKEFSLKEAEYDDKFAELQLMAKAANPDMTQTDLKAIATRDTYILRMEFIKSESAYKSANRTLQALYNRQEVLKELAYNLRAESKIR